ncbi:MAG: helix-turn-helix domain-containing protein [Lachnospiraceae bacterium]|jgi:carbohydrate diacid regulator|nr:helix-turn-helix domain-containing protein [Lachnospiraceae bacterium]
MKNTPETDNYKHLVNELCQITGIEFNVATDTKIDEISAANLRSLLNAYKINRSKTAFYENLLRGNLNYSELPSLAKTHHVPIEKTRIVMILEFENTFGASAFELLKNFFAADYNETFFALSEKEIGAIICPDSNSPESADTICSDLVYAFESDLFCSVKIALGKSKNALSGLPESAREARIAQEVRKRFHPNKTVIAYDELGIGRLLYGIPENTVKEFITETFGSETPPTLDAELSRTIHAFFDNNLNIAETARELYVHRNTLIHRLTKIEQITGKDIRIFENAVLLKIALMLM